MVSEAEKAFYSTSNFMNYMKGVKASTGFGSSSTARDVAEKYKDEIKGKVIIITGANSGVGKESARVFYQHGAHVIVGCRSESKGKEAIEGFKAEHPNAEGKLTFIPIDMSKFESIEKFHEEFLALNIPLNILLLNAGAVLAQEDYSVHDIEMTFAANHMGNYYLSELLIPKLKETEKSRIVFLSSGAQWTRFGAPDKEYPGYDELLKPAKYDSGGRYALAKLANMIHCRALAAKFKEEGTDITTFAVHPGFVSTNFGSSYGSAMSMFVANNPLGKTVPQGASTQVFACIAPEIAEKSGGFLSDVEFFQPNPLAEDPAVHKQLMEISERMLKETYLDKKEK